MLFTDLPTGDETYKHVLESHFLSSHINISLHLRENERFLCLSSGKLWSRSVKVAYNLLHKLGNKQEALVRPGDRVSPEVENMADEAQM